MSNFYTLGDMRQDLDSNLHAGGTAGLQNFYKTVDKGRRAMIGKVRPEELIRKSYIEQAFYPRVDRCSVPEDLKYDDIIDLNTLAGYRNVDTMSSPIESVYRRRWGQKRGGSKNVVNIGYENGVKYIRIFRPMRGNVLGGSTIGNNCRFQPITYCDSLTGNGIWNVGGNVVNLHEDHLNHIIGYGSLGFDINNSSTSGFLENFTLTPFSLLAFLNKGAVFAWLDFPIPKEVLAVKIILGSNASNLTTDLYTSTVNQPHDNNEFTTGWNLLKYMLNTIQVVGTPNPDALVYCRVEFTTTGKPVPGCHLDNIVARMGIVYEMTYNSSYVLMDAFSGAWKKIGTANSDIIVAEEDTYALLLKEVTLAAQQELYGSGIAAQSDVDDAASDLVMLYQKYKTEHKSEAILPQDDEYIFGNIYDGYSDPGLPGSGADGQNNWWN